jgi:hypothetical protein
MFCHSCSVIQVLSFIFCHSSPFIYVISSILYHRFSTIHDLFGLLIVTGDLESTVENPWSKYLLNSKFEEDLEIEFMGRYKGIPAVIDFS